MKKVILFGLLVSVTFSCRKKNVCNTDIYLTKITDPNGAYTTERNFFYNQQNRIIKIMTSYNSVAKVLNEFSYVSDSVLSRPLASSNANEQNDIKYLVNSQNNFLYRKSLRQYSFNPPEGPYYKFESDSSNYTYDNSGYLIQCGGMLVDSLSFYPYPSRGIVRTINKAVNYLAFYTKDSGNLKTIRRTLLLKTREIEAGIVSESINTVEETTDFFYDKNYPNVFDFNNVFLLKESNVLPFPLYYCNKNFRNYPNKAVTTRVLKTFGGNIISTTVVTEEPSLAFYNSGYIYSYSPDSQGGKVFFTYSCPQ